MAVERAGDRRLMAEAPFRWPVVLRNDALVLRPYVRADEAAYNEIRTHNQAWLKPWDATTPPEAGRFWYTFADMVRNQQNLAKEGRALPWTLTWDEGWPSRPSLRTRPIGQVGVNGITWGSSRSATIGYWIDQRWAGRGLVTLGVAMAADFCFGQLRLHRLEIDILPENGPSHAVVAKLGFKPDGIRRSMLHINGTWRDHDAFVMTADEAPASLVVELKRRGKFPSSGGVAAEPTG
ncbi:MAG: GNAT family N-acetyltransferase [Propionibacteriaceae bacterium]|nr:GNAT family N-acetyltransferase [Propionibacteriaceae bacterium]